MLTYDVAETFLRDVDSLGRERRQVLVSAIREFVEDVAAIEGGRQHAFRDSLRVRPMRGFPGVWEMSWEGTNGRATFEFGPFIDEGAPHIIWRRCGPHAAVDRP